MERHLNREIKLLEETETKGLFTWYLQEFSSEGKALPRKLVPWKWSLDFRATDLKYIRGFQSADADISQAGEHIRAILKPEPDFNSSPVTKYSMFGTDRLINDFSVNIHKLQNEQAAETCTLWGSVSHTFEIDCDYHTQEDLLCFRIDLKPENYDALCSFAKHGGNHDELLLSVKGVSGFYSEWSPLIRTNSVKVLTADEEQNVIQPHGHSEPPRLGEISEFTLRFLRRTKLYTEPVEKDVVPIADSVPSSAPSDANAALLPIIQQLQTTLKRLRLPIWIIVALLVLLLLR